MRCEGGSVTSNDVVEALLTPELWADPLRSSASWKERSMRVRSPIDEAISVAIRWDIDDGGLQKKISLVILLLCRGGECVRAGGKAAQWYREDGFAVTVGKVAEMEM